MMSSIVPAIGTDAPDFTLSSTSGREVTLSALRGRAVLLAFFPEAGTSVCTAELCEMRDDWDQFERSRTSVLPISVDPVATLVAYKAEHGMRADLLSDATRAVSRSYGVLIEKEQVANRAYFLVDPSGVLRWVHVEVHGGFKRSNAEIFEQIAKLD